MSVHDHQSPSTEHGDTAADISSAPSGSVGATGELSPHDLVRRTEAAVDFLRLAYGTEAKGHLALWAKGAGSEFPLATDLERAAEIAVRENWYFGLGLQPAPLPDGQRGVAGKVIAIPGVWVDLDIAGPAHVAGNLPPDVTAAMSIVDGFPLPPTVIIDSGHGLHVHWLFPKPWILDDSNRTEAQNLVRRFQDTLRVATSWDIDPTADLARVLRAPGSINHKWWKGCDPVLVRALEAHPDRRYEPEDILAAMPVELPSAPTVQVPTAPAVAAAIPEGKRNDTLASTAGRLRRRGMDEAAILARLRIENDRCVPPLPETELASIAKSIGSKEPGPTQYELSDLGNARRLVDAHGHDLRFAPQLNRWFTWERRRWAPDLTGEVYRRAKRSAEAILAEAAATSDPNLFKHGLRAQSHAGITNAIVLAATEPGVPILVDELDRGTKLLTVRNGTLNLETGQLLQHDRADLITKISMVDWDPKAIAPVFHSFLEKILPDAETRAYLQLVVGYSLTGDVSEHTLFICHGIGANGKSTLFDVLHGLLGEHAAPASPKLLMAERYEQHPTAIADLQGRRLVTTSEVEDGRRLDEALVKQLTGGDQLKGRHMRQDFFEFRPTHKIWLGCNHKPVIRGTDQGIWRRLRLIPFTVRIPDDEQDKHLADKLRAELPGILRWAVDGCLAWQQAGLATPSAVVEATDCYRVESDVIAQFLEEVCFKDPKIQVRSHDVYAAYKAWCGANGLDRPLSQKALNKQLTERQVQRSENGVGQAIWVGMGLLATREAQGAEAL